MAANTMAMIADQYAAREAGATKVKAVIMDGGTWETIVAMNSGASVSDAANSAAAAFGDFLAQVANDGTVQDVVYFLVPEAAGIPGVAGAATSPQAGLRHERRSGVTSSICSRSGPATPTTASRAPSPSRPKQVRSPSPPRSGP
jgi:hypothetical protein